MHKTSLTGIVIILVIFLVLTGVIASNIDVGETHQALPGIDESATTSSVWDSIWDAFLNWWDDLWHAETTGNMTYIIPGPG